MTRDEFSLPIEAFALRDGMTFATLIGMPERDRKIIVATTVSGFDPDAVSIERVRCKSAWLERSASVTAEQ